MLIRHRAVPQESLSRGHGIVHRRGPQEIAADPLRRPLVIGGMKDFGLRVAPDRILLAVHVFELIQVLRHKEALDTVPGHITGPLVEGMHVAIRRHLLGTHQEAPRRGTGVPIGQAGHGHIDNDAVDRMEPLQGARGGRQEVERRGVGARRNEGVGIEGEGADHRGPDTGQFAIPGNVADGVGKLGNGRMHPVGRMACPEHSFETVAEGAVLLREEVPDGGERGQHRRVAHMQDGGREEHRRQLAEVQARAGFLHHLIGRGETLGNGEGIPMFGELLQADRLEHIDARQRPAIGRKRLNAPILLPSVVRQVVVFPALGIEDERTVAPACGQRRLNVEHALACPCRRAEKDMLRAIIIEGLLLHHPNDDSLRA